MFLGITPVSSVSKGLYFLTLPLVSVMRVIYRKIRHAHYLYIKRMVEKVSGARYLSKNTALAFHCRVFILLQNMAVSTTYFQVISCVKHRNNVQVFKASTVM